MNLKTKRGQVGYGCLAIFIGICICIYLTYTLHFSFIVGFFALIGIGNFLMSLDAKYDQKEHLELLRQVFAQSQLPLPELQSSPSYGFPHFTLTFPSKSELEQAEAEGCIAAFKQKIQALYGQTGPKDNPFDIERAVWVTYKDWQFPPDAFDFGKPNDQT